jgi:hypothetical protein
MTRPQLINIPHFASKQAVSTPDEVLDYIDLSSVPMQHEPPGPAIPQITTPLQQPDVPFYGTPVMPPPHFPSAPQFAQPEPPVPLITAPLTHPNIPTWKDQGQAIPHFPSAAMPPAPQATNPTHPPARGQPTQPGRYPPIPEIPETPPLARRSGGVPLLLRYLLLIVMVLIVLIVLGFVFRIL